MTTHQRLRDLTSTGGSGPSHTQDCSICLNAIAVSSNPIKLLGVSQHTKSPPSLASHSSLLRVPTRGITSASAKCYKAHPLRSSFARTAALLLILMPKSRSPQRSGNNFQVMCSRGTLKAMPPKKILQSSLRRHNQKRIRMCDIAKRKTRAI